MAIQRADNGTTTQQLEEDESKINQQIGAGKKIIRDEMNLLSNEFNRPDINEFSFDASHTDFDYDLISILDMNRRVVTKVSVDELSDILQRQRPKFDIDLRLDFGQT